MDTNRRRHPRIPMTVLVKISHPEFGVKVVKTKNISDSGLFVLVEPTQMPDIGVMVKGQVQGLADDPAVLDLEIVRIEEDGVGLRFVE